MEEESGSNELKGREDRDKDMVMVMVMVFFLWGFDISTPDRSVIVYGFIPNFLNFQFPQYPHFPSLSR